MPRVRAALTLAGVVAGVLVLPVVGRPVDRAHAVRPHVVSVPVDGSAVRRGVSFGLLGATWGRPAGDPGAAHVEVQVHAAGGWSEWVSLAPQDGGADGGTADARRAATVLAQAPAGRPVIVAEPIWVGPSDGVRARVVGPPRLAPSDVRLLLVDGGASAADADPRSAATWGGDADAATGRPDIYSRADWGADESLRTRACPGGPSYGSAALMGFVHHTDSGNGYTAAQVPGIIRSIYAYHVNANGWCDIGYNFLVDRFGRVWEGRYGGVDKPVIGAHTGGFNSDSFAASIIGTFATTAPSTPMLTALEKLFAWKLSLAYRDPAGHTTLTAAPFSGSRYAAGSTARFATVAGHRDADYTDCPGNAAYADLRAIRSGVRAAMGAGFVTPAASPTTLPMASGPVAISAGVVGAQTWTLTVTDASGAPVAAMSGNATRQDAVHVSWPLTTDAGVPVPPGTYTLRLTGTAPDGAHARPWTATVDVAPPVTVAVPPAVPLGTTVAAHGTGVPGHHVAVTVSDATGRRDTALARVGGDGRWSLAGVPASLDLGWTARDPAVDGYAARARTRIAPTLTGPDGVTTFVPAGSPAVLRGTALPGSGPVTVTGTTTGPPNGTATSATAPVGADGQWQVSVIPDAATSYAARDARNLRSAAVTIYPVADPTAEVSRTGYAERSWVVRGNAGGAPVPVRVDVRPAGGAWTQIATATAGSDGAFRVSGPLPVVTGRARWRVSTGYGTPDAGVVTVLAAFPPTATGPARTPWNAAVSLAGRAVPGDRVTLWTAPSGSTAWVRRSSVRATGDATWMLPWRFTADTAWRVTSRSGTSATGLTTVVPSLRGPAAVAAGAAARLTGRAVPGAEVTVERRPATGGSWLRAATVTAAADGRWSLVQRPRQPMAYRVTAAGHRSRQITVRVT